MICGRAAEHSKLLWQLYNCAMLVTINMSFVHVNLTHANEMLQFHMVEMSAANIGLQAAN